MHGTFQLVVSRAILNLINGERMKNEVFLRKNLQGQIRDGEYSDFIIIHKQKGILFLECKGGQITYKSDEVRWYQNGKQLKKSPLKLHTEYHYF